MHLEQDGDIKMKWLATKHMIVDLLTEPLQGVLFNALARSPDVVLCIIIQLCLYSHAIHFYPHNTLSCHDKVYGLRLCFLVESDRWFCAHHV